MAAPGRPRKFELDEVLDRAVDVFWRQGFEGTSMEDLTDAMGINRPSLYAAFGNKVSLFAHALKRYQDVELGYMQRAIEQPTARAVAESYLRSNVEAVTSTGKPVGCLTIQGGLSGRPGDAATFRLLSKSRRDAESRFADRFRTAINDGDLGPEEDPDELARYLFTVSDGVSVQAAGGYERAALGPVVDRALKAFPGVT